MTGLRWCPGCQANVRPKLLRECPRCGSTVEPVKPIKPTPQGGVEPEKIEIETEPETQIEFEEEFEFELEEELDLPDLEADLVQTPSSGRLVLNPKVKADGINPLCPDCEGPIRRLDGGDEDFPIVEFRCGCDELRFFEFKEVDSDD